MELLFCRIHAVTTIRQCCCDDVVLCLIVWTCMVMVILRHFWHFWYKAISLRVCIPFHFVNRCKTFTQSYMTHSGPPWPSAWIGRWHSTVVLNFRFQFFSGSSGGNSRKEDAIECYIRAANLFKMARNWSQAGKSFCEAANLHSKAGNRHDAATNYVDASNCFKKTDIQEAVNCLKQAISIYTDMGRFSMAAKHHQSIAEMYETEGNDLVCVSNIWAFGLISIKI